MGDPAQQQQIEGDPVAAFIIQRIEALEIEMRDFRDHAEQHWNDEARRFALIDQFLSPAMELDSLIKQLGEIGRNQNQMIVDLKGAIERELKAMRSAIRLAVGTAGLEQLQPHAQKN
jgi:hypothetical protein